MIEFFAFSVLRFKTNKIVKCEMLRFLLTFYRAKAMFVLGNSGQNLFMWLFPIPIKATMSIHWKSHQQMDIFLFFYLALCAHETCFMTRPWKRMVCMYFCQQQASQHNTVVAGKSLYFCWKRKKKSVLVRGLFQNCHMGYLNESFYAWSWV